MDRRNVPVVKKVEVVTPAEVEAEVSAPTEEVASEETKTEE
jgi:hypothetical protein